MTDSLNNSWTWQATGGNAAFFWDVHAKLVREAAARRDIEIERIDDKAFFLKHREKSVLFMEHLPALTTAASRAASHDKHITKVFLERAQVSTPKGNIFSSKDLDQALSYATAIGFPVVVKPFMGSGGNGVTSNIQDEGHFRRAWENIGAPGRYIVEKHIHGNDYRVLVVDGKFICAAQRIPVNITGDGESDVHQLIEKKNIQRSSNPYVGSKKVKLTNEMLHTLEKYGYNESSIIPTGVNIQLVPVANIGTGGESIDVTDDVHPGFAEIAIKAAHAIPGCFFAGVDLLAPDIAASPENQEYAVCEINTRADIGLHNFPSIGQGRDAAGALVQAIFPSAEPVETAFMKRARLTLRGAVVNTGMRRRIQTMASLNHLRGWVKNEGKEVCAVLCGSASAVDRVILALASRPSTFVAVEPWAGSVPKQFDIIK